MNGIEFVERLGRKTNMEYEVNGKTLPKVVLGSWAWGTGMNGSRMIFGTATDKEELKKVYNERVPSFF